MGLGSRDSKSLIVDRFELNTSMPSSLELIDYPIGFESLSLVSKCSAVFADSKLDGF